MAGFWEGLGNWLGNAFGWNQAQQANLGRQQEQAGVTGLQNLGQQGAAGAQRALGYTQSSLGANAGQTLQKAEQAAMPVARTIAAQTGNVAGRQALSAARTAGLNKGQAALEGGQAGGSAAAAAMPGALQQQMGNYYTGTGQGMQLQGQLAGQGIQGYGGEAGTGAGYAGTQGAQGQAGLKPATGLVQGVGSFVKQHLARGGITNGPALAGENGPEMVVPVEKLLRKRKTLEELLKLMAPQIEETTEPGPGESPETSNSDLLKRIEALEASK